MSKKKSSNQGICMVVGNRRGWGGASPFLKCSACGEEVMLNSMTQRERIRHKFDAFKQTTTFFCRCGNQVTKEGTPLEIAERETGLVKNT